MIAMSYYCKECSYETLFLHEAQEHADKTQHCMRIEGSVTAREVVVDLKKIAQAARDKAYDAEVMRLAREKGFVRSKKHNRP